MQAGSQCVVRWLICAAVIALMQVGGCETVGEDIRSIGEGLFAPTPAEAALWANDETDPDKRREGTMLLGNAPWGGDRVYLALYRARVDDSVGFLERDPLVKAAAIRALARHGLPEDALLIAPYLDDENYEVRWEAAKGLQRLHNELVVGDLLTVLNKYDEEAEVRVAVALALGQYAQDRVFQGLAEALDARELAVNFAAERSLQTLTGRSFGMDRQAWVSWHRTVEGDAFESGEDYLYPTYHRDDTLFEMLTFWTTRFEEQPAPPVGLLPRSERSTYEEAGENESAPRTEGG